MTGSFPYVSGHSDELSCIHKNFDLRNYAYDMYINYNTWKLRDCLNCKWWCCNTSWCSDCIVVYVCACVEGGKGKDVYIGERVIIPFL